jgi:hypothetical protein
MEHAAPSPAKQAASHGRGVVSAQRGATAGAAVRGAGVAQLTAARPQASRATRAFLILLTDAFTGE